MPNSIRNLSWAVVRDGHERHHVYRRTVDLHLKDGKISEITPAGARPTGPGEDVIDGTGMLRCNGASPEVPASSIVERIDRPPHFGVIEQREVGRGDAGARALNGRGSERREYRAVIHA